jgi:hypothetical protein
MMALLFQAALLDELNDVRELVLEVAPVAQQPPVVRRDRDTCHTTAGWAAWREAVNGLSPCARL